VSSTGLSAQLEDYIEAIGEACRAAGVARVTEIATRMEVTNPSVVRALRALKREGLVEQERYGFVRLTGDGERVAGSVQERHEVLADFLESVLGLDAATATQDACRMEHAISPETFERLRAVIAFTRSPARGPNWRRAFSRFYARRARRTSA
jgi:DtxR family transcriptional regulator, Mn-dependent transcriptional regulator